jgi:hypothetical protein
MRGNLILIRLDALDNLLGELSSLSPLGEIDQTIILPWTDEGAADDALIRRSYHMVRWCGKSSRKPLRSGRNPTPTSR